nr:hypothetical protein [Tanacetum cinerariifolium]
MEGLVGGGIRWEELGVRKTKVVMRWGGGCFMAKCFYLVTKMGDEAACRDVIKIEKRESKVERLEDENRVLKELKGVHSTVNSGEPVMEKEKSSKQGRKIADIDADVEINLEKPVGIEEVLEVVKAAKLITEVITTAGVDVNVASVQDTPITAAKATKVIVPRKIRGVIIQDPKETTTTVTVQPKVQAKDKGKAILIEELKPLKRQVQIDLDEEVAR